MERSWTLAIDLASVIAVILLENVGMGIVVVVVGIGVGGDGRLIIPLFLLLPSVIVRTVGLASADHDKCISI